VLAKEWNVIQVKYEKRLDQKAGRAARTHSWNGKHPNAYFNLQ